MLLAQCVGGALIVILLIMQAPAPKGSQGKPWVVQAWVLTCGADFVFFMLLYYPLVACLRWTVESCCPELLTCCQPNHSQRLGTHLRRVESVRRHLMEMGEARSQRLGIIEHGRSHRLPRRPLDGLIKSKNSDDHARLAEMIAVDATSEGPWTRKRPRGPGQTASTAVRPFPPGVVGSDWDPDESGEANRTTGKVNNIRRAKRVTTHDAGEVTRTHFPSEGSPQGRVPRRGVFSSDRTSRFGGHSIARSRSSPSSRTPTESPPPSEPRRLGTGPASDAIKKSMSYPARSSDLILQASERQNQLDQAQQVAQQLLSEATEQGGDGNGSNQSSLRSVDTFVSTSATETIRSIPSMESL